MTVCSSFRSSCARRPSALSPLIYLFSFIYWATHGVFVRLGNTRLYKLIHTYYLVVCCAAVEPHRARASIVLAGRTAANLVELY